MQRTAFSRFDLLVLGGMVLASVGCNDAGQSTEIADSTENRNGSLPLMSVGEVSTQRQTDFTAGEPTLAEPTEAAAPQEAQPAMSQAEVDLARALQLWDTCQSETIADDERYTQLQQIIERTTRAMSLSRGQAGQSGVFNMAAVTLANARMQLALTADAGDTTQSNLLSQEADELFRIDPTSMAATETAYRVVELAQAMAQRHRHDENTQWIVGYARQARLFGQRFPQESQRVPMNLVTSARMCEQAGLSDEARQCYSIVTANFDDSLLAVQAERALRRIDLVGQPIVGFAGETLAGSTLDVADLKGRTVVIVFWNSESPEFLQQYEHISLWKELYGDNLQIVGVNLETDEARVRDFVETHSFPGENIFFSDPLLRGETHPLAVQFAVGDAPSYWLISADGIVRGAPIRFDDLLDTLTQTQTAE